MWPILQIALIVASIAVIVLVAFLIPIFIELRKCADKTARQLEELKADVKLLVQDSRTMVQSVNSLSGRAHQQLDEVDKVVRIVRQWSERANRIVEEVAAAVEPPILSAARNISIFRKGLSIFLNALLNRHPEQKVEETHVRE